VILGGSSMKKGRATGAAAFRIWEGRSSKYNTNSGNVSCNLEMRDTAPKTVRLPVEVALRWRE